MVAPFSRNHKFCSQHTVLGIYGGSYHCRLNRDGRRLPYYKYPDDYFGLVCFLPDLGLTFRRLHDAGHSGWNILWNLLPIIGQIILLVYFCQQSQPMENKYGPVPNMTDGNYAYS